jgi:anti-sigma B factor antagonist
MRAILKLEQEVSMETAIGVFAAREHAEQAIKNLVENHVPEEAIVYLTRSESEAQSIGKQLGSYAGGFVGGAAGLSAGVAAATLLAVPGIGAVFALGFGAAALLGLVGAGTGAAIGSGASKGHGAPEPSTGTGTSADAAFFRQVLNEGHSLIVVRTESPQVASVACAILDKFGMSMKQGVEGKNKVTTRQLDGAIVADLVGKISLGEGTALLRDTIRQLSEQGNHFILLNLAGVDFIDSAGLGELVRTHATIRSHGGNLKLVNPSRTVHDLLRITKLDRVFDIERDEVTALDSLRNGPAAAKGAV